MEQTDLAPMHRSGSAVGSLFLGYSVQMNQTKKERQKNRWYDLKMKSLGLQKLLNPLDHWIASHEAHAHVSQLGLFVAVDEMRGDPETSAHGLESCC